MRLLQRFTVVVALPMLAACSDTPPTEPVVLIPQRNGAVVEEVVVLTATHADTIDASTSLRVQAFASSGFEAGGSTVVFTALPDPATGANLTLVAPANGRLVSPGVVEATTDSHGFATVDIGYSTRSGSPAIRIVSVPTQTTLVIPYVVRAGRLNSTVIRDTLATVGQTTRFGVRSFDRRGNERGDTAVFEAASGGASVTQDGLATPAITGLHTVRVRVNSAGRTLVDSAFLFTPPSTPVVWTGRQGQPVQPNPDAVYRGSLATQTAEMVSTSGLHAAWQPQRDRLAYNSYPDFVVQDIGGSKNVIPGTFGVAGTMLGEWAEYSPDGASLYYSSSSNYVSSIYKAKADGTDAVLFLSDAQMPTFSPDGASMAFSQGSVIKIMTLQTGAVRQLTPFDGPFASSPRWSPDGQTIAYLSGQTLKLVRADNGVQTTVTPGTWQPGLSWSADGVWLFATPTAATGYNTVLIHVPTQKQFAPKWLGGFAAWKR